MRDCGVCVAYGQPARVPPGPCGFPFHALANAHSKVFAQCFKKNAFILPALPSSSTPLRAHGSVPRDAFDFCELPFFIAERADRARLEPALNAVQVKDVAAAPEGDGEAVFVVRARVGLVFDRGFVEGVPADGACVGANVPAPPAKKAGRA